MPIFDCDGVLVDSEAIAVDAELAFLAAVPGLHEDQRRHAGATPPNRRRINRLPPARRWRRD